MARILESLLFIFFGLGLLFVVRNAWRSGSLRVRGYNPTRDDNPLGFMLFSGIYTFGGIALWFWAH